VEDFCRWVSDEPLRGCRRPRAAEDHQGPAAFKKFTTGPAKTAYVEAKKLVEQSEPEIGSDFLKRLEKMRQPCTDAAQVKEIRKIRTER
jgi:hypothetical protein